MSTLSELLQRQQLFLMIVRQLPFFGLLAQIFFQKNEIVPFFMA